MLRAKRVELRRFRGRVILEKLVIPLSGLEGGRHELLQLAIDAQRLVHRSANDSSYSDDENKVLGG